MFNIFYKSNIFSLVMKNIINKVKKTLFFRKTTRNTKKMSRIKIFYLKKILTQIYFRLFFDRTRSFRFSPKETSSKINNFHFAQNLYGIRKKR